MSSSLKILVADDESIGRQLLEAILMPEGYDLLFGTNGQEALDSALANVPDIILLDVMMPKLDGFEVCKKIKKNADTAHIPVFLITALDDRDSRIRGIDAGADDYISKPFDRIEILGKIKNKSALLKSQKSHHTSKLENKRAPEASEKNKLLPEVSMLLEYLLKSDPPETNLILSGTLPSTESQHIFLGQRTPFGDYFFFASNQLSGKEAGIANALLVTIWKNALLQHASDSKDNFSACLTEQSRLIAGTFSGSLDLAGFSMIQIFRTDAAGEIRITGMNHSLFVRQEVHSSGQNQPSAFEHFSLQGNQELSFTGPGNLLLLSSNMLALVKPQELMDYLNTSFSDTTREERLKALQKKYEALKDLLIIDLPF